MREGYKKYRVTITNPTVEIECEALSRQQAVEDAKQAIKQGICDLDFEIEEVDAN